MTHHNVPLVPALAGALLLLTACDRPEPEPKPEPEREDPVVFDVWYGDEQHFGHLGGHPQRWINILGQVWSDREIDRFGYVLNREKFQRVKLGPDRQRLAREGDFNVEILRTDLRPGENELLLRAILADGEILTHRMKIDYAPESGRWPLPYEIDWSEVASIPEAVQVVDGKWKLVPGGIRVAERHYDRILAMGDESWKNYEVATTVTVHDLTPPGTGRNQTEVSHAAIAVRWPGHEADHRKPSVKWFPLGATGEFRIGAGGGDCRWRLFDGKRELQVESERRRTIEWERPHAMKHRVETLPDGRTWNRVKLWPAGTPEPSEWDLERFEPDDLASGSALLLAHHTDVTFGDVTVIPVDPETPAEAGAPGSTAEPAAPAGSPPPPPPPGSGD